MSRTASPGSRRITVSTKLSPAEVAAIDARRGSLTRSAWLASLVVRELSAAGELPAPAARPTALRRAERPAEPPAVPQVPAPAPVAPSAAIDPRPTGSDAPLRGPLAPLAPPVSCSRCHGAVRCRIGSWYCAGQCGRLEHADGNWRVAET